MPTYTLPFDAVEDLVKIFRGVVPQDVGNPEASRVDDGDVYALAEMIAISQNVALDWARMAVVSYADGPFLELQARGVGLNKSAGEDDDTLRARVQRPPDAITPDLILTALQAIVTPIDNTNPVYLVELPRDGFAYSKDRAWHKGRRWSANGRGTVIALIPETAHSVATAVSDALRAKVSAGKDYLVQEYDVP